jgi:hypothetical protein
MATGNALPQENIAQTFGTASHEKQPRQVDPSYRATQPEEVPDKPIERATRLARHPLLNLSRSRISPTQRVDFRKEE